MFGSNVFSSVQSMLQKENLIRESQIRESEQNPYGMVNLKTIEHLSTFDKVHESQNHEQIEQAIGNGANLHSNISTINQMTLGKTPAQSIMNPFGSSANIAVTSESRKSPSNKNSIQGGSEINRYNSLSQQIKPLSSSEQDKLNYIEDKQKD